MQISNLKLKLWEISIPTKSPPGFILSDGRIRKFRGDSSSQIFLKTHRNLRKIIHANINHVKIIRKKMISLVSGSKAIC